MKILSFLFIPFLIIACSSENPNTKNEDPKVDPPVENDIQFYYGADLSYLNEMEDCGATYENTNGITKDPYTIFKEAGTNLIRIRLWHHPTWTNYSNYGDAKTSIQRAKDLNMKVFTRFSLLGYLG
jgi:arabinogalactan endo-1,4-beta-galactosidase